LSQIVGLQSNLTFGVSGLVYSPSGLNGHNILSNVSGYNWIFVGDSYVSTDNIIMNSPFNISINVNTSFLTQNNYYQLYYLGNPFTSSVQYTGGSTLTFANIILNASGNLNITLKKVSPSPVIDVQSYYLNVSTPTPTPCFKEDTQILTNKGYVLIQDLRKGDLIKTLRDGYKPINMIGKREIYHEALKEERIKEQLYKCSKEQYPDVFEDLIITGAHCILVDSFKDDLEREKTIEVNGRIFVTDGRYRLPACVDSRTTVYENKGMYTIYHFALEHDNFIMNYGIYANGLLVETCSKRYLQEDSGMILIE